MSGSRKRDAIDISGASSDRESKPDAKKLKKSRLRGEEAILTVSTISLSIYYNYGCMEAIKLLCILNV